MRFVKPTWLSSLSVQVLLVYIAGAALSILLIMLAATAIVSSQGKILSGVDVAATTQDMAHELQFDSNGIPAGFDTHGVDFAWIFEKLTEDAAYRVLDASGNVALSSAAGERFWLNSKAHRLERGRFEFKHQGIAIRGATAPIEHEGRIWYLQFATSTRFLELMYNAFALPFTIAGVSLFSVVLLFVFGPCVYATLRYTLRPLRAVSESATAISPHSIHARLKTQAVPTEIVPLVDSFNRALERLEQDYRVQQEFLGNAAHELKTPLALIRAQIELREDARNDSDALLSDVEYMTRQVQQLLLLAEAREVRNYHFAIVRVHEVADEALAYLQRMAEAADVRLEVSEAVDEVHWNADRSALFTLLKNLLENAIQHAPAQSAVSVDIRHDAVTVRDVGPGVDAGQLPRLFERFWRAAHRRDHGAGLGLAICQEIALAHGWQLTAERAEPGLLFRLSKSEKA